MANGNSNPNINRSLNGLFPLSYMGVNPSSPAQTVFENRAPTTNDSKNYLLGTLWTWQTSTVNGSPPPPLVPAQIWMLTALQQGQATWTQINPSSLPAEFSLAGDIGIATGNPIKISATNTAGSSTSFQASGSTVDFYTSDANSNTIIGSNAGNATLSGSANVGLGTGALHSITAANYDTAIGTLAGNQFTTGQYNTLLGYSAGYNYTTSESSNICIGYNTEGTITENHTLRIGNGTGNSTAGNLAATYICGIDGVNVASTAQVVTEHSNQLGTAVITAGTGISVTPGANTITIAATGIGTGSSVLGVGVSTIIGANQKLWLAPFSGSSTSTQANAEFSMPLAGTISNLYVNVGTSNTGANTTITVNKNGSNTTLVATTTAGTTGTYTDLTHSFTVAAGDTIQFESAADTSGTATGTISVLFVA